MNNIVLLFAAKFFRNLDFFSPVVLLYYSNVAGLSTPQFLYLQGIFSLFIFLLEVPTGIVADKYSRKLSLLLSSLMMLIGFFVLYIARNFFGVLLAEFFIATSIALCSGAFESLFYDSHKKVMPSYNKNLAVFSNLGLIAILVATLSGAFFADYFGLENIYLICMIPAFLAFICFLFIKEVKCKSESEVDRNFSILGAVKKVLQSNRRLRFLALDLALIPAIAFMGIWLYQPFLQSFSVSYYAFGILHAFMILSQVFINFVLPRFKKATHFYIKSSQIFITLMFLVLAISNNIWIGSIALVLIVGVGMTRNTFLNKEINSHIESSFRSTFFSAVSMLNHLLRMLLTFIVGLLINHSFGFVVLVLSILTFIAYLFFRKFE